MTDFEDFSKGQRLLYLMFAYESYTIDEIEDLLEIDTHLSAHRLCRYEVCSDLIWYHWMVMGHKTCGR